MAASIYIVTSIILLSFLDFISCQAVPIKVCGSGAPGYDVGNLTARIWTFEGKNQNCLPVNNTIPPTCVFYMGLCQRLQMPPICSDSSVCQSSPANSTFYKLAAYSSDPFYLYTVPPGFTTKFEGGEIINSTGTGGKTCQLQTQINFQCNSNSFWPKDSQSSLIPHSPKIVYDASKCSYNITFDYAGACLKIEPSTPVTQLSGGTVLIIIFVVSLFTYFTFGAILKLARGHHGKDVIPNSDFWMMLPVYVADGILFTIRCGKVPQRDYDPIE
ncbi:hypothetical protein LOTGIDRAFT_228086 [Lottia gigantea]|uniref:Autophagy-related protein 27 n=1 Tax=Lottia gigantea TaxID=225164 RepID=V4B4X3_LOTGI|nr:hypothetical protein LOTGIDRAFT_228086 [Lottia gigantea]ESP05548.1 hypothetical protein LOTGIDRAFT_228086 [Lottia gigantea]